MKRTVETATIIARPQGLTPFRRDGLREIDHGRWESLRRSDVEAQFPQEYTEWEEDPFIYAPLGGESGLSVMARALPVIREVVLKHAGENVAVVSHKATIRLIVSSLLGFDPRGYRDRLDQAPACLNVLDVKDPVLARLMVFNDVSHYVDQPGRCRRDCPSGGMWRSSSSSKLSAVMIAQLRPQDLVLDFANFSRYFLQGAALGFTAAATPGSLQTLLISETLLGGFRRGARITLAPLITDAPIIMAVLLILNQVPPVALQILSIAGGLFVLYLAWGLLKQWRRGPQATTTVEGAQPIGWRGLWRASIVNWLNPNPYIFWTLVGGPTLIAALQQSIAYGVAFLVGMYGVFVGSMLIIVAVFHFARNLGPRIVRGLLLISIGVLAIFGILLIQRGLS
jgi:broad specificity phosphatase PhoE/threonine/homoserine/homoserine lactone efflux protein